MFDDKSRYARLPTYVVLDHRGRMVEVVPVPARPDQPLMGIHVLKQGERPDHLAAKYLSDPAGYWRIAERNDVMFPESLGAPPLGTPAGSANGARELEIPGR
jgi:hypothetical protein